MPTTAEELDELFATAKRLELCSEFELDELRKSVTSGKAPPSKVASTLQSAIAVREQKESVAATMPSDAASPTEHLRHTFRELHQAAYVEGFVSWEEVDEGIKTDDLGTDAEVQQRCADLWIRCAQRHSGRARGASVHSCMVAIQQLLASKVQAAKDAAKASEESHARGPDSGKAEKSGRSLCDSASLGALAGRIDSLFGVARGVKNDSRMRFLKELGAELFDGVLFSLDSALRLLGEALESEKRGAKAVPVYERLIDLNIEYPDSYERHLPGDLPMRHNNLALALKREELYAQATVAYTEALRLAERVGHSDAKIMKDNLDKCESFMNRGFTPQGPDGESPLTLRTGADERKRMQRHGNVAFKDRKHCAAIRYYTAALAADEGAPKSERAVLLCNRATAWQKIESQDARMFAEYDAREATIQDADYAKGWYRYGQALMTRDGFGEGSFDGDFVAQVEHARTALERAAWFNAEDADIERALEYCKKRHAFRKEQGEKTGATRTSGTPAAAAPAR